MPKRYWAAAALIVALMAGCSQPAGPARSATPTAATSSVSPSSWTATTLAGKRFDAKSLMGKPALLWFWAPWCPICESQIADVSSVVKKYGRRVSIIGVGGLDQAAAIRHGKEVIPGVTTLVDDRQTVWTTFGIYGQANYVVLNADGNVVYNSANERWRPMVDEVATVAG
jgi:thiol-disulfide isomerase/thioredoxin